MSNVVSVIAPVNEVRKPGYPGPVPDDALDIVLRQVSRLSLDDHDGQDQLGLLPAEIRLMIFENLLIVWPDPVYRGARTFGLLEEFEEEIPIPWQILATCRTYFQEAMPIMYSKNKLVFCTGVGGEPGTSRRFPIQPRYMPYITDLGIYLRSDTPTEEECRRVAHFIKAITRLAVNLKHLVILVSSNSAKTIGEREWVLYGNPVAMALDDLLEAKTVKDIKLRVHDGAGVFPGFADFLYQTFKGTNPAGWSLTFTRSCTCNSPPNPGDYFCPHCKLPLDLFYDPDLFDFQPDQGPSFFFETLTWYLS